MKLIQVPHYSQGGSSDCQAACAAMVMDYWRNRNDGGNSERLAELLAEFSRGFEREAGGASPAITGLVARTIAEMGFTVYFYSNNPDGGGTDGMSFLTRGCWQWSDEDVDRYAEHARSEMHGARDAGVIVHNRPMTAEEIEEAINGEKPVVAIVDVFVLKEGYSESTNHAVVITGIDGEYVAIHDPAESEGHKLHNRKLFFEAHRRKETDNEAYVAVPVEPQKRPYQYECWELDGHILANIHGKEYVIDTGSAHSYTSADSITICGLNFETNTPPANLLESLTRNVSPGISGLIGLDIMGDYDVWISLRNRLITFHASGLAFPRSYPVLIERSDESVPILKGLRAGGRQIRPLFDLGARFSYLAIEEAEHERSFGSAWDFWPMDPAVDRFPVRLHKVTICLAGQEFPMTVGNREDVVRLPDVEIIGSNLLKYFDINIALRRDLIEFQPVPAHVTPART